MLPTAEVNFYDIETNRWMSLPNLGQPRFSATLIESGGCLFCFGGQNSDPSGRHYTLASIEKLDLEREGAEWEPLECKLPSKGSQFGAISIKPREVVIFGGWEKSHG